MVNRILIIDNDTDFCEACKNLLESNNFTVEYQADEEEAISTIKAFKPDLILLDIVMKKSTSGFDIASLIAKDESIKTTPVAFLTGYFKKDALSQNDNETIKKWDNIKGVIDKPVKPASLLEVIGQI